MPKNASGLETEAHRAERSFFDMTGNTNVYGYITTEGKITGKKSGRITALEYLQKSTGVFNGGGLLSEEKVAEMQVRLKENKGNIWHGFVSLNKEQSYKIDTPEKCIGMIKATFGQFFKDAKLDKNNIDLMCALHLDRPEHLHFHFVFWEKEPKYKGKDGTLGYRRRGKIEKTAIDNLFVRLGLYIDGGRDKLYRSRVEAIRALRGMTAIRKAMTSKDEIKEAVTALAKALPEKGRLTYGSKDMTAYKGRVDDIVAMMLGYDGKARKAHLRFMRELKRKEAVIKRICGKEYAVTDKNVAAEEIEKNFPKYHNKIDESKLTIISDIEADYKRRQGNLVLGLAKAIKPYVRDKPETVKLKPNDKQYKRRRAIATYNVRSLFNKFLRSFADDSELLERDFSHRLQDIEKEMEEERKRENGEKTEVNYKD